MKYVFFLCFLLNYNVILAQYVPFNLKRNNSTSLSAFGESVNRINNNHEEALRIRNQIVSELRRIDLNEADDEWKTNYIDKIKKRIDNEASYGNYSSALPIAKELESSAFENPELLVRIQANKDYKEFRNYIREHDSSNKLKGNIQEYKIAINKECKALGIQISQLIYKNEYYPKLGDLLYNYSIAILEKPYSYKDWLYLLYLSAKCQNENAVEAMKAYRLDKYSEMTKGHSSNLFNLNN